MPRQLSLSVVGADYLNADKSKSNRRFEIALCAPGDPVRLVPEPKNPADQNAIGVFSERGVQIGYVSAERAPLINKLLQEDVAQAIFQCTAGYGAVIRVGFGEEPELPAQRDPQVDNRVSVSSDSGFYPDYIPPDD